MGIARIVLAAAIATCGMNAWGGISFSGADGATSWIWVEGEDWSAWSNGSGVECPNSELVSGYRSNIKQNAFLNPDHGQSWGTWNITAPTDWSNVAMYLRGCTSFNDRPFSVLMGDQNGEVIGGFTSTPETNSSQLPIHWMSTSLTMGMNQGDQTISIRNEVYDYLHLDGFFMTNGTIDTANMPATAGDNNGWYFMQAPTFTELPTLEGVLNIAIDGTPDHARYFVNGQEVSLVDGVLTLDQSGTYYIDVRLGTGEGVGTGAGLAFYLNVPEPNTLALMLGVGAMLLRKRM